MLKRILILGAIAGLMGCTSAEAPTAAPDETNVVAEEPEATPETPVQSEDEPEVKDTENKADNQITQAEYGEDWAFTVEEGELRCVRWNSQPAVTFYSPETQKAYGLNGPGQAMINEFDPEAQLEDVWLENSELINELQALDAYDPSNGIPRISVGPFIEKGLTICGE